MGIDYGLYVGPYAECKVETVQITKTRKACVNSTCANHIRTVHASAFCHMCGSPIRPVEYTEPEQAVNQWDMTEDLREKLCSASGDTYYTWSREHGLHLWSPNVTMAGRRMHLETREDFALYEITPEQIRDEVARFEAQFSTEIERLRQAYGTDAVRVTWGVIQDYS